MVWSGMVWSGMVWQTVLAAMAGRFRAKRAARSWARASRYRSRAHMWLIGRGDYRHALIPKEVATVRCNRQRLGTTGPP